jgi:hypothetical protein
VQGGIFTLVSLIVLLSLAFGSIGETVKRAQRARHLSARRSRSLEMLAWGLGVSLASHCVSWISVSYFGQMTLIFHALFALIVTVSQTPELARRPARSPRVRASEAPATPPRPAEPPGDRSRGPRLVDVR